MSKKKLSHLKVDLLYYRQITELLNELMGLTDEICDLLWCSGLNSGMLKYLNSVNSKAIRFSTIEYRKDLELKTKIEKLNDVRLVKKGIKRVKKAN